MAIAFKVAEWYYGYVDSLRYGYNTTDALSHRVSHMKGEYLLPFYEIGVEFYP